MNLALWAALSAAVWFESCSWAFKHKQLLIFQDILQRTEHASCKKEDWTVHSWMQSIYENTKSGRRKEIVSWKYNID